MRLALQTTLPPAVLGLRLKAWEQETPGGGLLG